MSTGPYKPMPEDKRDETAARRQAKRTEQQPSRETIADAIDKAMAPNGELRGDE